MLSELVDEARLADSGLGAGLSIFEECLAFSSRRREELPLVAVFAGGVVQNIHIMPLILNLIANETLEDLVNMRNADVVVAGQDWADWWQADRLYGL